MAIDDALSLIFSLPAVVIIVLILLGWYIFAWLMQKKYATITLGDGSAFTVADYPDKIDAAILLAHLNTYAITVLRTLKRQYAAANDTGGDVAIAQQFGNYATFVHSLITKFNPTVIQENAPDNADTSYVIDKGNELAICLRGAGNSLHDIELLKFVLLHEMTHIGSHETGHEEEFWTNFRWLLHYLSDHGLYTPRDYRRHPQLYCGKILVKHNPW